MKRLSVFACSLLVSSFCGAAVAQVQFPSKAVRFIVPAAQGGNADILTRIIGDAMARSMGQPVIVDNRPGGSSTIGAALIAKAPPDGYTIGMIASTFAVTASISSDLPYDAIKDFSPVSFVGSTSILLVSNPGLPATSIPELIALAKSKPATLNYGSSGIGSPAHLAGELFGVLTGTKLVHVPYKSMGPATNDTISGTIELGFPTMSLALPFIKSGKLRALGITDPKRSPLAPNIPAIAESVPGYQASLWNGVIATGGTPHGVISRLNAEIKNAVNNPQVNEKLTGLGLRIETSSPEEFAEFIAAEVKKWPRVIKEAGIKIELER